MNFKNSGSSLIIFVLPQVKAVSLCQQSRCFKHSPSYNSCFMVIASA